MVGSLNALSSSTKGTFTFPALAGIRQHAIKIHGKGSYRPVRDRRPAWSTTNSAACPTPTPGAGGLWHAARQVLVREMDGRTR